jgi:hypothetical protein
VSVLGVGTKHEMRIPHRHLHRRVSSQVARGDALGKVIRRRALEHIFNEKP